MISDQWGKDQLFNKWLEVIGYMFQNKEVRAHTSPYLMAYGLKKEMAFAHLPSLCHLAHVYMCMCAFTHISQIISKKCKRCRPASLSRFPTLLSARLCPAQPLQVTSSGPGTRSSRTLLCPSQHRKGEAG